jgi:plastocyanin
VKTAGVGVTGFRRAAVVGALGFVLAVGVFAAVSVAGSGGASGDDGPRVLGPGPVTVRLVVKDSVFSPARIHVRPHTDVTFEIVNRDFINHEFIIGGGDVHARHEDGHEPYHPAVPGEVSILAHQTARTTYSLHSAGRVLFACHLPRHFAYGMKGFVIVDRA